MLKGVSSAVAAATEVTATNVIADNAVVRGDGGARAVQDSAVTIDDTGNVIFTVASTGPTLKRGANGRVGTFVANGATPVTVSNTSIAITDAITISLNTVGGAGPITQPVVLTITAGVGFTVGASATDSSTYNYAIIKNAA